MERERAEREVREYREWIERYTPKEFRGSRTSELSPVIRTRG